MNKRHGAQIETNKQKNLFEHNYFIFFFLTLRVVKHRHRFSSKVIESPPLEIPRTQLDHIPEHPALAQAAVSRTLDEVISRPPFPPQLSCDSVTSFLTFFYTPLILKLVHNLTSRGYPVLYTA